MRKYRIIIGIATIAMTCPQLWPQGYGGPSMLSRGGNRPGQRGRASSSIVAYGALRAVAVETGLTPVQLDPNGSIAKDDWYGGQAEIGAYGTQSWKRTTLGIDYRGDYRYSTQSSQYNGTNQALSLDLLYTINRRAAIFFRETGGTTNRAFGGFLAPAITDPYAVNLANDEVFDTRTYFSETQLGASFRTSSRMTYTVSGDVFFAKRTDPRLISTQGYRALGAGDYRLNSRTNVGAFYYYMTYEFPRVYGETMMHAGALTFRRRVSRNIDVNLIGGAIRLRAQGTESVRLSPEVAALLGRPTGVQAFDRYAWVPQISATVNYTLERSRFTVAYTTGVSPGNGVILTSQRSSLSAGYSFSGTRKLSVGISSRYMNTASKAIVTQDISTIAGGGGLNYALTRLINLSTQFDYRQFRSGGIPGRSGVYLTFGLSVSPARIPVSIW